MIFTFPRGKSAMQPACGRFITKDLKAFFSCLYIIVFLVEQIICYEYDEISLCMKEGD